MSRYDTTRNKLETLVKAFHDASYATMEVNYPKQMITDVEKTKVPFAMVEFVIRAKDMGLPSGQCVRFEGQLVLNHYAKMGSGSKLFTDYTDALMDYLGLKTLDSITFREVQPYDNVGIPGFDGIMNSVNFDIDYFNV